MKIRIYWRSFLLRGILLAFVVTSLALLGSRNVDFVYQAY